MAIATQNSIERSSVIISVFSTTPGIGKTIVAINLAAGLAHEGYRVCLADLDLQFGDVLNYLKLNSVNTVAGENIRNNSESAITLCNTTTAA